LGEWRIVVAPGAMKTLLGLEPRRRQKIRTAIDALMAGDVKKLKGRSHQYRLRVGDFRVVFSPDYATKTLAVLEVFGRGRGY